MLIGTNIYAFVIGVMSSWVNTFDKEERIHNKKTATIQRYFDVHSIPTYLQEMIIKHMENEKKLGNDKDI